jgi:hypothetical protein
VGRLYKKVVKARGKSYVYYYHNFKIEGKVRNMCLGSDLGKAQRELRKIIREKKKTNQPICRIIRDRWKPASKSV